MSEQNTAPPVGPPSTVATSSEVHFWRISEVRTLCGIWMPFEYPNVTLRYNDVTCSKCAILLGISPNNQRSHAHDENL
jgi:hypothetical protein